MITALKTFSTNDTLHVVFKDMFTHLGCLVACPACPNKGQLGAMFPYTVK